MRQMFEGGKDKSTVLEAFKNLHRPKEYWNQMAEGEPKKQSMPLQR